MTKVLVSTTAMMQLYEQGFIDLDDAVSVYLGPEFNSHPGKERITLRNLMLHNAGYPEDPSPAYNSKEFGCPSSTFSHPPLSFSCQTNIHKALLGQDLKYAPGQEYLYSDLSFITLMYVIGHAVRVNALVPESFLLPECVSASLVNGDATAQPPSLPVDQCYYEAYIRRSVVDALGIPRMLFRPPPALWAEIAPTENDTTYRHTVVEGAVHDENAYASGGVQGHAGLFASAPATARLVHRIMFAGQYSPNTYHVNATTVKTFTTVADASFSSRALGWDTNLDQVSCGSLSTTAFRHTGFTGTQACCDVDRGVFTVLHTNRVYPTRDDEKHLVVRTKFNSAVQRIVDALSHH